MSHLSPVPRSHSRASSAASDTTYHSFCEVGPCEPALPYDDAGRGADPLTAPFGMRRQDSGYESSTPSRTQTACRPRTPASVSLSGPHPKLRRSVRRGSKSGPVARVPLDDNIRESGIRLISPIRSHASRQQPQKNTDYHFPLFSFPQDVQLVRGTESEGDPGPGTATSATNTSRAQCVTSLPSEMQTFHPVPQTTQYWTSDGTRRLEYAAIDAASRGIRGWLIRHMVPDCFIPEDDRPIRFNDDRRSVVRYRLELDGDNALQKEELGRTKKRKGWWFSTRSG